ncbi:Metacaspase-1 OS=Candida albicans (strain SC5314 / ATCC MYA-2876) GN=MCA1 PE=3 SV=1 [Rhizoctonia solani AG-1 IB]|uniref:Metacaspase-1 n=1 Tax=Thanatephorus cucumeris (strain AG1-IB / isolate 7/3/14) TaxID=1108050 RepID=A0A0B7FG50_THACB|nr:Metacaspase-1 OS=Candida albicans (strain SC5314 / ATCC MYA-2876) GN=MCA1 PE=3 SV=1 [Rhizoctonia solani AG-1 IB]
MNFGRTTGDAEAPVAHQWYTDTQDDDTQTWSSSVLTRTPVPLSIKVPKSAIHSVPCLASGAPISSNEAHISPQHEWYREYHSPSIPSSMSDWSFSPPSYSYSHDPLPRPTGVTRNILRASSSDDVQWHRESRQNSTAGYDNYSIRNNLGPPRRVSTTLNSPLFPSLNSVQDVLYSYIEEEDLENFEPDTARSQSPGPFSPEDSEGAPECMISSSLADNPGKRRALIIALEYRGPGQKWNDYASTPLNMQGPYSDGDDVYHLLLQQGYQEDEITYMTDKPNTPALLQPTCMNIKYQLARLVADANPGDRFFLYYAGHGIQVEDTNGDEFDGWDEAIIPTDWATTYNYRDEGLIIDDYLKEACVNTLPKGAHLTAVFDCCHAGTIMDLPYEHSTKENGLKFKSNKLTGLFSRRLPSRHGSVDGRVVCSLKFDIPTRLVTNILAMHQRLRG